MDQNKTPHGFTLIEISIVLVIIGLIVGGVMVGQDLIRAAGERAQLTQIEKFNTAVNTFYGKYGYLPGDINANAATQFGFTPRGQYAGEGDGNGVLEGVFQDHFGSNYGWDEGAGEVIMFWVDLTTANGLNLNLIEGSFSTASPTTVPVGLVTGVALNNYFPTAKIGGGNYIYAYSKQYQFGTSNQNFFGLSVITSLLANPSSNPGLTVKQAYDIDRKMDDGLPTTGRVRAFYVDNVAFGANGTGWSPNAAAPSSTTCYDTTSNNYSIAQNGGTGINCALSFTIQGGD
jgi:prepilin-type N-terminal cleavage/methylation domain-containing protein